MTPDAFTIRSPHEDEFDAWHALWQGYLEFYRSSLPAVTTESLWRRLLDPASPLECRVAAADDGQLLGLVHFFPHPHTWYEGSVCYLNDLFVDPSTRGNGAGEALIAAVVEVARSRGWAEVYWHTQADNAVARGLYDKVTGGTDGFVNYTIAIEGAN